MRARVSTAMLFFLVGLALGKAAYQGKRKLIKNSDLAIVGRITETDTTTKKTRHRICNQRAVVKVDSVLFGTTDSVITVYGGEDFICARNNWNKGRFLIFLRKEDGYYLGSNWH